MDSKRTPCKNRVELFEPYLRQEESLADRGARLNSCIRICRSCPLLARKECLMLGLKAKDSRGIWGGEVITDLMKEEMNVTI